MKVVIDDIIKNVPTRNNRVYTTEIMELLYSQISELATQRRCCVEFSERDLFSLDIREDAVVNLRNIRAIVTNVTLTDRFEVELNFINGHEAYESLLEQSFARITPVVCATCNDVYGFSVVNEDVRFVKFLMVPGQTSIA